VLDDDTKLAYIADEYWSEYADKIEVKP